jgi:hypothetical protein
MAGSTPVGGGHAMRRNVAECTVGSAGGAARAVSYAQHGSVGAGDGGPRWGMWGEVCGFAMIGRGGAMCRVTPFGLTRPTQMK